MPFIIDDNKHLVQFSISMIKMKKESEPKSASELGNSNNAEKDFVHGQTRKRQERKTN